MTDRRKEALAKLQARGHAIKPRVSTEQHGSYEVIRPRITLKDKAAVYTDRRSTMDFSAIDRAEKALTELTTEFFSWMDEEVQKLIQAFDAIEGHGPGDARLSTLYRVSHDIKGSAATFGFPFATMVANGLTQIILYCDQDMPPIEIMRSHVFAIRAIVREDARGETDITAQALAAQLQIMTSNYLGKVQPISRDVAAERAGRYSGLSH